MLHEASLHLSTATSVRGWSVFAVDPGEVTGWAWACIGRNELVKLGAVGALQAASKHVGGTQGADRRFQYGQVDSGSEWRIGGELEAATTLLVEATRCGHMAHRTSGGSVSGISELPVEDFLLREGTQDRSLLSPVRLTSMFLAKVDSTADMDPSIVLYQPSQAKSTVTNDRLKRWGFWLVGQQHARDAVRHLILHLKNLENALNGIA